MNLELYDNLKGEIGEKAARVIAEAIPGEDRVATRSDVEHIVGSRIDRLEARLTRWMLGLFVPLWVGVYGTLAAVVITLIVRGG